VGRADGMTLREVVGSDRPLLLGRFALVWPVIKGKNRAREEGRQKEAKTRLSSYLGPPLLAQDRIGLA